MAPFNVGIVGTGNISGIYLRNLGRFRSTHVLAVADIDRDRAESVAQEHNVPLVLDPEELVRHPGIDLVLNLTVPSAHGPIAMEALKAGKHAYNEKPLAANFQAGEALVAEAHSKGVRLGCAPDTFLGAGLQTARNALDEGLIGEPVAAQAFMLGRGPDGWHPNPDFFFKAGSGPMLDMGQYYVTALVHLLGPVSATTGMTRASFPIRTINRGPQQGRQIVVETPTHVVGVMQFKSGVIAEIATSFDVYFGHLHPITIYGSEGTMKVPDPNTFGGDVLVRRPGEADWQKIPLRFGFEENSRGLGVLDIFHSLKAGSEHRASGKLALHVLEVMTSFERASEEGMRQEISTSVERPAPLEPDAYADEADAEKAMAQPSRSP